MIESHVINFDLSKKLYEIGIKKESLFYWEKLKSEEIQLVNHYHFSDICTPIERYPAYIASEILGMIPINIRLSDSAITLWRPNNHYYYIDTGNENLCNAIAKMIIYVIKNKLYDVSEINK